MSAVDNVLQRMTIVGVLLSFRCLAQEALLDVCIATVLYRCKKQCQPLHYASYAAAVHRATNCRGPPFYEADDESILVDLTEVFHFSFFLSLMDKGIIRYLSMAGLNN